MTVTVTGVEALEILDSRGRPTLAVTITLGDGTVARAGVPSGASTGSREAVELRDGDPGRFSGKGVLGAAGNVNGEIAEEDPGPDIRRSGRAGSNPDRSRWHRKQVPPGGQRRRRGVDGRRPGDRRLGRRGAVALPQPAGVAPRLPVPHFNVVNGGVHAPNDLDFQEFMVAPLGAPTMAEAVRAGAEVYATLRGLLAAKGFATGLGDEGGFAPEIDQPEEVLALLVGAIEEAGYRPGRDGVAIAMDPASSEFYRDGKYHVAGESLSSDDMIDRYAEMVEHFPVWLLEDGLAESDWDGWERLTARLGRPGRAGR